MEALPEAHGRSVEQSQPLETCAKMAMEKRQRRRARSQSGSTSSSLMPPRSIPLPLFYSPRREAVIICYIILILYPSGQRYTSILSLLNAYYLGFTSVDLYLPTYYTTKSVPACKGRFTHAKLGFLLGTVFFTTSAPT